METETTVVDVVSNFTPDDINIIMGTVRLVQGVCLMLIAIVAIFILYKIINHFF